MSNILQISNICRLDLQKISDLILKNNWELGEDFSNRNNR